MEQKSFKLNSPPLVMVLAQVVISDILSMEKHVPEIQERLRYHGFPLFEQEDNSHITFAPNNQPQVVTTRRWLFRSPDERSAVILTQGFMVLVTNAYGSFREFVGTLADVLNTVRNVTHVQIARRAGLRYVNWIPVPNEGLLSEMLDKRLLGLPKASDSEITSLMRKYEQFDQSGIARHMITRVIQTSDGSFLPQDLIPQPINFQLRESPKQGNLAAILDIDHFEIFQGDNTGFDSEKLLDTIGKLHDAIEARFLSFVTNTALKHWGLAEEDSPFVGTEG